MRTVIVPKARMAYDFVPGSLCATGRASLRLTAGKDPAEGA